MSAIWTGVSGMQAYSSGIANTSNNLANSGTVGYKSSRMLFADLLSTAAGGTSDGSQIGCGSQVGSVSLNTTAGSTQTASNSTDMAITGDYGHFIVKNPKDDAVYYTRAGNFNRDKNGYLTTAAGYNVQGFAVDQDAIDKAAASGTTLTQVPTTGTATDILIPKEALPAKSTSSMTMITNLDSQTSIGAKDSTDPYFTMFKSYDATNDPPVSDADYSATQTVYDSEGNAHTITTYYSKVADQNGKQYWEYTVAMDPDEDGNSATKGTTKAGVLMVGTLTYNASGTLENETAYTLSGSDPTSLSSWTQASLSDSGTPQFSATFLSSTSGSALAAQTIAYGNGLSTTTGSWDGSAPSTAAGIGATAANNAGFATSSTKNATSSSTNYGTSSSTLKKTQDGYASGSLLSTSVDKDGVIYGNYSNGQEKALFVVALADFNNASDLANAGNNLYQSNDLTGKARVSRANTGRLDSIAGYTLETSNVDMATEMVNLITLQRAFQSNSKVVTTSDAMMEKAMEIKK